MKFIQSNEFDPLIYQIHQKKQLFSLTLIKDIELSLAPLKVPVALLFRHHS